MQHRFPPLIRLIFEIFSLTGRFTEAESQSLIELGVDSLGLVELSIELEEQYEIRLDINALNSSSTIRELIDQLERARG